MDPHAVLLPKQLQTSMENPNHPTILPPPQFSKKSRLWLMKVDVKGKPGERGSIGTHDDARPVHSIQGGHRCSSPVHRGQVLGFGGQGGNIPAILVWGQDTRNP